MARTTYNAGPGRIQVGTLAPVYIYSQGDINITEDFETFPINTAEFGKVDERAKERKFEVTFTPAGELESLTTLYPHLSASIGSDIFPQTDIPLLIRGVDGTKRTYNACAVTKMPSLSMASQKTAFGPITFACLGTGDMPWDYAGSATAQATGQTMPAASLTIANIVTQAYTGVWGTKGAPWNALQTIDGFEIDFNLGLFDKETDGLGIQQKMITGLEVTLKFKPIGMIESDVVTAMNYQGTGAGRGKSLLGYGANMVISAGTTPLILTATVKNAFIKDYKLAFGFSVPRIGEITMIAGKQTTIPTGLLSDYFAIGLS
jgi:hypothetical protein